MYINLIRNFTVINYSVLNLLSFEFLISVYLSDMLKKKIENKSTKAQNETILLQYIR
jgi:hypothetical protein